MTPAINLLKKKQVEHKIHHYEHDATSTSYGLEAVEKLGLESQCVFKTLVIQLDIAVLAVAIIPVAEKLSMKSCAKQCQVKKATMADKALVEKTTGYVLGGVSPLGQKKRLKTLLDSSALEFTTVYVSAGRRGLEIELSPQDLVLLSNAQVAALCL